jgi:hypothetical protein
MNKFEFIATGKNSVKEKFFDNSDFVKLSEKFVVEVRQERDVKPNIMFGVLDFIPREIKTTFTLSMLASEGYKFFNEIQKNRWIVFHSTKYFVNDLSYGEDSTNPNMSTIGIVCA